MSKKIWFKQCKMARPIEGGKSVTTSYIPEQYAHLGKVLKLKDGDGEWSDGWVVEHVGHRVEDDEMFDSHQAIKNHRKATGDSMPKEKKS